MNSVPEPRINIKRVHYRLSQQLIDVLRSFIMDTLELAIDSIGPEGLTECCANPNSQRMAVIGQGESAWKVWVQEV